MNLDARPEPAVRLSRWCRSLSSDGGRDCRRATRLRKSFVERVAPELAPGALRALRASARANGSTHVPSYAGIKYLTGGLRSDLQRAPAIQSPAFN
jgi:hypothetical protein